MYQKVFQIGFLILAIIITIYNVRDRFFTKRVNKTFITYIASNVHDMILDDGEL